MRIVVFGASGSTGRLLTEQALAAGHDVVAATRRPADFPIRHEQLSVVEADAHDGQAVDRAVDGADVVLSTLGVSFTRKPVNIYSDGIRNIIAAMSRHRAERVVVVTSTATEPHHHADGRFLLNWVLQPLVSATIAKTVYSDMRRMEALLRDSDLRWTIMRPSKLFDAPGVSSYELHEDPAPGIFTSRADLAASLLQQATDDRFVRKAVEVTTSHGVPTRLCVSVRTMAPTPPPLTSSHARYRTPPGPRRQGRKSAASGTNVPKSSSSPGLAAVGKAPPCFVACQDTD